MKPILMSTEMVKAILKGWKCQTRRIIKPQPWCGMTGGVEPKYKAGDILWVRETFSEKDGKIIYRADVCSKHDLPDGCVWKPSIFMPKSHCRLVVLVMDVRLQRLHEITHDDAICEGIEMQYDHQNKKMMYKDYSTKGNHKLDSPIDSFKSLWSFINGADSWDKNPLVFAYHFKVLDNQI